jgi:retron-type reverse transcriptase
VKICSAKVLYLKGSGGLTSPLYDPAFSENSYGFREGRSTHGAIPKSYFEKLGLISLKMKLKAYQS